MIVIKMQGGLGNQMFQYALANLIAKKNNASVLLDMSFFNQREKKLGHTPRNFELGIFINLYSQASVKDLILFNQLSTINKIKRELGFNYPKIYGEASFTFNKKVLSIKAPAYLRGYFQSYKYFKGYENFIKEIFSFPIDTLDTVNKKLLLDIKTSNTIALHVRRGDYINDKNTQQFHGSCSLDYYLDAIALIASKINDLKIIFFSDDSQWVREQFKDLPYPTRFVDHNEGEHSWKDLLLMSSCSHNIIANSSFSWWAAWLNGNNEKIVIAPKNWFASSEINTDDLIPPQWLRL